VSANRRGFRYRIRSGRTLRTPATSIYAGALPGVANTYRSLYPRPSVKWSLPDALRVLRG